MAVGKISTDTTHRAVIAELLVAYAVPCTAVCGQIKCDCWRVTCNLFVLVMYFEGQVRNGKILAELECHADSSATAGVC